MIYYSQFGQDYILDKMFSGQKKSFFVEVGCIDGRLFSNTLFFENKGWRGMCIEAHPDYIEILKKNRTNSLVCHCAISDQDKEEVVFYTEPEGSLSTLQLPDASVMRNNYGKSLSDFSKVKVPQRSLSSVFDEYNVKYIDILSIDIEGLEEDAIRGMDFNKLRPKVLLIEIKNVKHERVIYGILKKYGYYRSIRVRGDFFYVLDKKMNDKVKNKIFHTTVHLTEHPYNKKIGNIKKEYTIDTRMFSLKNIRFYLQWYLLPIKNYIKKNINLFGLNARSLAKHRNIK